MIYFISEKKMSLFIFMFAICIFIKPQAFIFTPILIFGIIENVFIKDFSKEKLLKNLGFGVSAIILMVLLALPFGISNVIDQYTTTMASYPYLTVNAFNLWGAWVKKLGRSFIVHNCYRLCIPYCHCRIFGICIL